MAKRPEVTVAVMQRIIERMKGGETFAAFQLAKELGISIQLATSSLKILNKQGDVHIVDKMVNPDSLRTVWLYNVKKRQAVMNFQKQNWLSPLMKGVAQNDDARIEAVGESYCSMGVGCVSGGPCYADKNGQPESCMRKVLVN